MLEKAIRKYVLDTKRRRSLFTNPANTIQGQNLFEEVRYIDDYF